MSSSPTQSVLASNRFRLSRGQAVDIPAIDHGLLKLLLPQIQSMFKYFDHMPILRSINVEALSDEYGDSSLNSLLSSSTSHAQHQQNNENQSQQNQHQLFDPSSKFITNAVMHLLKGIMIYSTLIHYDIATPGMSYVKTTFKPPIPSSSLAKPIFSRRNNHRNKVYRYLFLSTILPLIHELIKWKGSSYDNQINNIVTNSSHNHINSYGNSDTNITVNDSFITSRNRRQELIGLRRKLHILQSILKFTSLTIPPLQLYAYISNLSNSTTPLSSSPSIEMQCSGLEYDTLPQGRNQRSINFSYAQRRLWYEEMMLTCGMIVPIEIWNDIPGVIVTYVSRLVFSLVSLSIG